MKKKEKNKEKEEEGIVDSMLRMNTWVPCRGCRQNEDHILE